MRCIYRVLLRKLFLMQINIDRWTSSNYIWRKIRPLFIIVSVNVKRKIAIVQIQWNDSMYSSVMDLNL
jgi:hypothetical protein